MIKQIDIGLANLEFKDNLGNTIGTVQYNPGDLGIAKRADSAIKQLTKAKAEYKDQDDTLEAFDKTEKEICRILDYIFLTPVSEVVFKNVSPLSITKSGVYVFENVLEALISEVEKAVKENSEVSKKRVLKYTDEYI